MAFDKTYPNRKDWRKPYRKSGRFDATCRPGGSCPYCRDNRQHADKVRKLMALESEREVKES
jgi:hypothetical protein